MEPILDETSLVPCLSWSPDERLRMLARVLKELDELGAPRILRSVRDAADRDIGEGNGLRTWCYRVSDRDAGRLIATRLDRQPPFIDGSDGAFSRAEGHRVSEARVGGIQVFGLGLAALTDGIAIALGSATISAGSSIAVQLSHIDLDGDYAEHLLVERFVQPSEIQETRTRSMIRERIDRSIGNGRDLVARAPEVFPNLRFGARAREQVSNVSGSDPVFRQLLRHLRVLDLGAREWRPDAPFSPSGGLTWSVESQATLNDGRLGSMRDFPVPDGFSVERWSLHTKLTGGAGARLYFRPERAEEAVILIGYFGVHLPTVRQRT